MCHLTIFTSRVSGLGNRIGLVFPCFRLSVCLSVCQLVGAFRAKPFAVQTRNLVHGLTLIKSRPSSMVIGQGHLVKNVIFPGFSNLKDLIQISDLTKYPGL